MKMNDLPPPPGSNEPPPRRMPGPGRTLGGSSRPSLPPFNQLRPAAQFIGGLLYVLVVLVLLLLITGAAALILTVIREAT